MPFCCLALLVLRQIDWFELLYHTSFNINSFPCVYAEVPLKSSFSNPKQRVWHNIIYLGQGVWNIASDQISWERKEAVINQIKTWLYVRFCHVSIVLNVPLIFLTKLVWVSNLFIYLVIVSHILYCWALV